MIWPVTAMEYAGCEEPDDLGFVLTMLGYVNPSAAAGLCAELLSGCIPNKVSYIGVEGSRVVVLVGPSHWVTGSSGQSIAGAKLQEQWTTIRTKLPAKTGEYALEVVEVEEETSVAELLRTVVSQKLADPVHAGAPAGAKDDIFIIFTKCLWLTEWRKSENTYGPSPDAGRIIDENIDAMKAFANKGGRSQAPTIVLSGPGIVWHGTAMQEVATTFFMKCRDAGFPAYPSNAMWFGCSKKSLNGGVVGIERGGHQFMGLVSAFTDLVCVLRREYSMSDEVREALAIALDFMVENDYLMKPSESYLSAAKQCGVRAGLTPVDRWSSSEDAPWAEVISAPRTMSSGQCATSHASSANAPAATSARTSEQQSVPRPYAGKGPQTMAQRVRSSTPPATGRQRLGQAMADFGQSAASRGLSPAVCGNQRGTIPAKPAQACGYSPTTTGGPSKTGGHRIDLKPATGKQMLKVKPDPPELPKDAYTDDFPSLAKREAANRWRGGATRRDRCHAGSWPSAKVCRSLCQRT